MRSSIFNFTSISRFSGTTSILRNSSSSSSPSSSQNLIKTPSTTTTRQLSAKATVDTLTKLLDGGHVNAFCSILRDGFYRTEKKVTVSSSTNDNNNKNKNSSSQSQSSKVLLSPFPSPTGLDASDALIRSSAPFTNQYQKQMRLLLRRSVHDALQVQQEQQQQEQQDLQKEEGKEKKKELKAAADSSSSSKATKTKSQQQISPASWMVLANVAVSQGMWIRSLEIFDQLAGGGGKMKNMTINHHFPTSSSTTTIKPSRPTSSPRRLPAPHTIAQTLRPGNIEIIRKWCRLNDARLDIITGMNVLVEYSDNWAAALRLALEEERQPLSAPRGAVESYSLGVLIPFLANGGKWTTASAVLADALARGSLVSDSLVQMILKSTAQKRTWVSCLALTSSLSSCFALSPSSSSSLMMRSNSSPTMNTSTSTATTAMNEERNASYHIDSVKNPELLSTLRSVASVCRTWEQACAMITVCRMAGMKSGDEFIIGSAMEKLQRHGKWVEASQLIHTAVNDGTLSFSTKTSSSPSSSSQPSDTASSSSMMMTSTNEEVSWMANLNKTHLETIIARRLIDSFKAERQWSKAIRALSWMTKADTAAAAAGVIATIELCASAGQWQAAAEIGSKVFYPNNNVNTSTSTETSSSSSISSSLPTSFSTSFVRSENFYLTLIRVLSGAGKWREAAQTFSEMVQDSNLVSLMSLSSESATVTATPPLTSDENENNIESEEENEDRNKLADMNQMSVTNNHQQLNACDAIIEACTRDSNNWIAALSFFERALSWEPRILLAVSNYETVVKACLAAARWREAVSVIRLQRRNGVELGIPQIRTGLWAAALSSLQSVCVNDSDEQSDNNKNIIHNNNKTDEVTTGSVSSSSSPTMSSSLPSVPNWLACLRFYELLPAHRRTTGDTQIVSDLARSVSMDRTAGLALQRALFTIAATGGGGSGGSNRHHRSRKNSSSSTTTRGSRR